MLLTNLHNIISISVDYSLKMFSEAIKFFGQFLVSELVSHKLIEIYRNLVRISKVYPTPERFVVSENVSIHEVGVGGIWWLWQQRNILVGKPITNSCCHMWSGIVVL